MTTSLIPSLFDFKKLDPFTVGYDKFFTDLEDLTDIEVSLQGNKLTVQGSTSEEDTNEVQDYIFKGIANRNFTRTFNLADKIEIKDAEIVNGMLKIWLDSLVETQANIKKIAIK
jgi:HSP20 family molecular chaperone IbpA